MSSADPNVVIVTGENPFIRLSVTDSDDYTTNASFWLAHGNASQNCFDYLRIAGEAILDLRGLSG
jgi:hypothetical protein